MFQIRLDQVRWSKQFDSKTICFPLLLVMSGLLRACGPTAHICLGTQKCAFTISVALSH